MTQSGSTAFDLRPTLGIVLGEGLIIAIFAAYGWWKRRHKVARNERPPLQTKILRPAGHSLSCRIDELTEKLIFASGESLAAGMMLGLLLMVIYPLFEGLLLHRFTFSQLRAAPGFYYVYSLLFLIVAAMAWTTAAIVKTIQRRNEMRNCQLGLRGEQVVAEVLTNPELLAAGYVTFHDVPGDGPWNIDHVVIGLGGIFVLETKTRVRRKPTRDQLDQDVFFDGKVLQFPWCSDFRAARQVQRNAEWVRKFVADFAPRDMMVQPVIVLPGWYAKSLGNYSVKAMPPEYLVKSYLLPPKRQFTPEQLRPLVRRFDERCRDLEF